MGVTGPVDGAGCLRHTGPAGGQGEAGMGDEIEAEVQAAGDTGPVLDLERYVPGLLTFMANKLSRAASTLYGRAFGVNVTEWRILSQLAIEPGIPASRICQVIGLDKGPVSRTLSTMEAAGLVAGLSDRVDARRRLMRLTPAGRALHDEILAVALEREERLLACLSADERDTLIALLNRLHGHLGAVANPPER